MLGSVDEGQNEVVIEPRRGKGEAPVPPGALMGFTPMDLTLIRKTLGLGESPDRRVDLAKLWTCPSPWEGVVLAGPAMGAPAAALLLERLIALGAKWVIGVGSCGSLQPDLTIGEVILPTGALVEEGTSPHYLAPGVRTTPDAELLGALRDALSASGVSPHEGRIWTTDAPFRETREKVIRYGRDGVLAVEMETSALMTVASFRRTPFASALVVSDEIGGLRWKRGFESPGYLQGLARVAKVAVGVLSEKSREEAGRAEDR